MIHMIAVHWRIMGDQRRRLAEAVTGNLAGRQRVHVEERATKPEPSVASALRAPGRLPVPAVT
jgi:hypothetical protein